MKAHGKLRFLAPLLAATLLSFALRSYRLAEAPLSWDEGWSIGLSSLSWGEIQRITALDVHPPLFYWVFKLWLAVSRHEAWLRFLSVMVGVLAVPLAYVAARLWCRSAGAAHNERLVGVLAALAVALSPFLVYYSQVARMFALCATLTVLALYCLLKALDKEAPIAYTAWVASAVAALYTFYYSALILAAAYVYALLVRPRRWRALLLSGTVIVLLYVPWLAYAVPPMLQRVGSRTGFAFKLADLLSFVKDGVFGLAFAYEAGWTAVYVIIGLIAIGIALAWRSRESLSAVLLPLLAISLSLLVVSLGARAHMFAARYLISASPPLAMLLAWATAMFWRRARWLGALALMLFVLSIQPTMARYVYDKPYEVSGEFDPGADYHYLRERTCRDDIIFFNVLSLAGHYERLRTSEDPPWSYALRWDPVVEPLELALNERVQPAAAKHRRLWFVLYKGTVAANLPLKQWLDVNLFPVFGEWRKDTLYLQYLAPTDHLARVEPDVTFGEGIQLREASFTSQAVDDRVVVQLTWSSIAEIGQSYKVFVHLYSIDGTLVAQHDSVPVNELRPTWSWKSGEQIVDNHGLLVPAESPEALRLVVGLYDPDTGTRLTLHDGSDHAEIGVVRWMPSAPQS